MLAAAAALTLTIAAAPAAGQAPTFGSETLPLKSDNVSLLATLPVGKPIGARFRDQYMYVTGTEGLEIYDVSKPELPILTGALPLPHFENEDVDLGGDILLISNDPSETVGFLYVIDISDPSLPKLKGVMENGVGDGQAQDVLDIFGVPPVDGLPETGIGHTASCVNADCTWAYLAGTSKGITIVDLRDPAAPKVAGGFVPDITGLATHDVQLDANGVAWIVGADGTAGYDVSDPLNPRLIARTDEAIKNSGQLGIPSVPDDPVFHFGEAIGGEGETPIDLIHHDSLRLGTLAKVAPGQAPAGSTVVSVPPPASTPPASGGGRAGSKARALRKCRKLKRAKKRRACVRRVKQRYAARGGSRAAGRNGGSFALAPFAQQAVKTTPPAATRRCSASSRRTTTARRARAPARSRPGV
jgi:hypothetical protein